MHRTSLAWISRPGIASACARFDSSRLRDSWNASVFCAPGSTMMFPFHTAVERPVSTPRNARSEVVFGAACSCVVSKSMCWRPWVAYAPVTRASDPSPPSRVSIRTWPRADPNPSATQSSEASRPTSARCAPKIQLFSASP